MYQPGFFNKWWLLMMEGIILLIVSYFLFNEEGIHIISIKNILGFTALLNGSISIIGYFLTGSDEKNKWEMFLGILNSFTGLLLLSSLLLDRQIANWLFLINMFLNAVLLLLASSQLKAEIHWWWISFISMASTIFLIYCLNTGTIIDQLKLGILAGFQFFITGLLLIVFAFVMRKMQEDFSKTIKQISSHNG